MNIWEQVLARVEGKVGRHPFYTWFRPTTFLAEDRTSITVSVPNAVFTDWLPKHYSRVIAEALAELRRPGLTVNFVPESSADTPPIQLGPDETAVLESAGVPPMPPSIMAPGAVAGLNPRYTFDTFIVGSSNQFAHAACRAVAEAP